jgi:GTPase
VTHPDPDDDARGPLGSSAYRAGFVCLVGRPNTGKSTLVNALVGAKVVITSSKPQTTRRVVRGIVNRPDGQLVLVDTPGVHRPRTLLGSRLNDEARSAVAEVDVKVLTVPADEPVGPGDRYIAQELLAPGRAPRLAVVTKADRVGPSAMAPQLTAVAQLAEELGFVWDEVVPVSAQQGQQVDLLASLLLQRMPVSQPLFPTDEGAPVTDLPLDEWIAELVREAALEGVHDELPHSLAVVVDEILPREDRPADRPLTDIHATVFVERDSQKAIVIGKRGERLSSVGRRARAEIEQVLGGPVYLDLHVTVAKDWQRDPRQLRKLGF